MTLTLAAHRVYDVDSGCTLCICVLQALRRFEHMSSINIRGAVKILDLAMLAVELEEEAGAWRVSGAYCYEPGQ